MIIRFDFNNWVNVEQELIEIIYYLILFNIIFYFNYIRFSLPKYTG